MVERRQLDHLPTAFPLRPRQTAGRMAGALPHGCAPGSMQAQYFGRNKVPYEPFGFEVPKTAHWNVHYYKEEVLAARGCAASLISSVHNF